MKTIWKYRVPSTGEFGLEMPEGAELLSFDGQVEPAPDGVTTVTNGCVWALVDPRARKVTRCFRMVGTGYPAADVNAGMYVGSALLYDTTLVLHLFDLGEMA